MQLAFFSLNSTGCSMSMNNNPPQFFTVWLYCACVCRKRQYEDTEERPYIQKTPIALMVFSAEQNQKAMEVLDMTDSATVSKQLGQRVRERKCILCGQQR